MSGHRAPDSLFSSLLVSTRNGITQRPQNQFTASELAPLFSSIYQSGLNCWNARWRLAPEEKESRAFKKMWIMSEEVNHTGNICKRFALQNQESVILCERGIVSTFFSVLPQTQRESRIVKCAWGSANLWVALETIQASKHCCAPDTW